MIYKAGAIFIGLIFYIGLFWGLPKLKFTDTAEWLKFVLFQHIFVGFALGLTLLLVFFVKKDWF